MTVDVFTERLAKVRFRFVSTLQSKINDAYSALPGLSDTSPQAALTTAETYRAMHSIVGVGPTVGFPATGRAARDVEETLRLPQNDGRGLSTDEVTLYKKRLHALREAAQRELEFFHAR
jgi:chemotaxis protein histidine kinase CheA